MPSSEQLQYFDQIPPREGEYIIPPTHESQELPFAGKVAILTGGSRDVGAGIVRELAKRGTTGIAGYRNKGARAKQVEADIAQYGNPFKFVPGDITTPEGVQSLTQALDSMVPQKEEEGQVDFLILNAASGDRDLNVVANNALIDKFLPRMRKGGKIVYMQSTPGHYNSILSPIDLIPDIYKKVASTKDEAERSIRSRSKEMQEREVSLVTFVAPAVPDSWNVQMFTRRDKAASEKFGEIASKLGLPSVMTIEEVSSSIADILEKDTGANHLELFGPYLDGRHVLGNIYGENEIYVDVKNTSSGIGRMIVTPDRADKWSEMKLDNSVSLGESGDGGDVLSGSLIVEESHAEGHFRPESELPLVFPGHKHIRAAVKTLGWPIFYR